MTLCWIRKLDPKGSFCPHLGIFGKKSFNNHCVRLHSSSIQSIYWWSGWVCFKSCCFEGVRLGWTEFIWLFFFFFFFFIESQVLRVLMVHSHKHRGGCGKLSRSYSKDVFRLTWPKLKPHFATGTNKQGLSCNDVASARPEGGSNKFKLHSSSTSKWPFSLLKGCHIAPGHVLTKVFLFATFQIDCRLFIHVINWPAAIILTQLCRFQFWLFIHFTLWFSPRNVLLET